MGEDANPNQFSYDILYNNIKAGQQLVFTEKQFPAGDKITFAIKIDGFDVA